MAKSKKAAAQYESGTLAAFAVVGILLIALGVVSLLAVVGGLQGRVFFPWSSASCRAWAADFAWGSACC